MNMLKPNAEAQAGDVQQNWAFHQLQQTCRFTSSNYSTIENDDLSVV